MLEGGEEEGRRIFILNNAKVSVMRKPVFRIPNTFKYIFNIEKRLDVSGLYFSSQHIRFSSIQGMTCLHLGFVLLI